MARILNMLNYGRNNKMSNNTYQGLISVIVSTYNWPDALKLVLTALNNQNDENFEVIIVDDGSTSATKKMIEQFKTVARFPLKHLWQEDKGFRLSRARNMGIKEASGDYIIFIDGDCIVRPKFLTNHRILAKIGHYVAGNRILLSPKFSNTLLDLKFDVSKKSLAYWLKQRFLKHINRWHTLLTIGLNSQIRYKHARKWQKAKGCNMAFWRQDLLNICGFEEEISGWGYEDSDLMIRLINHGIRRKSGYFATTVLHLWHKEADRSQEQNNLKRLNNLMKSNKAMVHKSLLLQKDES